MKIAIISSSVRNGRNSHRVAIYFKNFIEQNKIADTEIIDLLNYNFPVFEERLKYLSTPSEGIKDFTNRIKNADGIIIVTPEYNGGYPASLKNAIDLLYDEWYHKPIALATVSEGQFGGSQVITSLLFTLWKIKALVATTVFPVIKVEETFDAEGNPSDRVSTDKRARAFFNELLWCINAKQKTDVYPEAI